MATPKWRNGRYRRAENVAARKEALPDAKTRRRVVEVIESS
jgi:hypothetical protein